MKMEKQPKTLSFIPQDQVSASSHPADTKSMLIVEDHLRFPGLLKQLFENQYAVYEAGDANVAMSIALQKNPDLIICDVMITGINGMDFCKLIKQTFETSHIPFIILSSKDTLDAKIEGLSSGADYYFAEPLSHELLTLTVKNIFLQQQKLKERFADNYFTGHTELVNAEKGNIFVNKLLDIIEKHIDNQELGVEFLCNHLFISRTKLYQKIRSLSNQSVGEFVRTVRLKKAIHIMTHEDVTISEVAERIGLPNVSNFSRFFKKKQGKSPLQFIQSLKKQMPAKNWSYMIMNSYLLHFFIQLA